jgi:hypothetical protein
MKALLRHRTHRHRVEIAPPFRQSADQPQNRSANLPRTPLRLGPRLDWCKSGSPMLLIGARNSIQVFVELRLCTRHRRIRPMHRNPARARENQHRRNNADPHPRESAPTLPPRLSPSRLSPSR